MPPTDMWLLLAYVILGILPLLLLPQLVPHQTFQSRRYAPFGQRQGCSLDLLAGHLNAIDWGRFRELASRSATCPQRLELYGEFLHTLLPYVAAEPHPPFVVQQRPVPLKATLNCADPRWSTILTGIARERPLQVLYFVPIGYNVRLLEVLLYELHDAVDFFVLFESDATQIGVRKDLFLNATLSRWQRFRHKLILLSSHIPDELATHVRQSACSRSPRGRDWVLERRMREDPMEQFRHLMSRYRLDPPEQVLAIGSDADEIASGEAVYHLSRCALHPEVDLDNRIVYFGTLMAKYSLSTLQILRDGRCSAGHQEPGDLAPYVWGAGPVGMTLRRVLSEGAVPRVYPSAVGCLNHFDRSSVYVMHLPIGSAIHLSTMSEPTMQLFKEGGTMEALDNFDGMSVLPLLRAGLAGFVPLALLQSMVPQRDFRTTSVFQLSRPAQEVWNRSVPWVMRENPDRFCFELPDGLPKGGPSTCRTVWPCLGDLHPLLL
eukprot:GGOE01040683.1.p1 GENE.GGOE01040683.1~~GGOE01040683.1.p1  ORF type:complete len:490 (-),score=142.02 GGOE01040683.1:55-1524(-)